MKRLLPFILLTLIALLYTLPFFRPGFFSTHDGEWAVIRLVEMQRELKDLQIPPRWSDYLNHGYGYPLFLYTYPFPYYLGIVFRAFRIGLVDTIKVIFVGSLLLGAISMYLLGKELTSKYGGFIAALFYTIAPFRLVNLYVRGSLGESVSLAIAPLLFYLSLKFILKPSLITLSSASLMLAVFILSHNIMALSFFPFWIFFLYIMLISYFEDIRVYTLKYFFPMILLGLGLSAYFFVPALLEKKYVILSRVRLANVSSNFINFSDFFISKWNYGLKPSFQLGWAHVLGVLLSFFSVLFSNRIYRKKYLLLAGFIFFSISVLVFFTLPASKVFWDIPPLSWIDFPWRLLSPLTFFLALGCLFLSIHKKTKVIGVFFAILILVLSYRFAKPKDYFKKPDVYYATNDATTTSMDELMPIWVVDTPRERYQEKVEIEKGEGVISDLDYDSKKIEFSINSLSPTTLKVNTIYFPGWKFYLDHDELDLDYSYSDGLIRFKIPSGEYQIRGRFTETSVRMVSNIISLVSFGVLFGLTGFSFISKLKIY